MSELINDEAVGSCGEVLSLARFEGSQAWLEPLAPTQVVGSF